MANINIKQSILGHLTGFKARMADLQNTSNNSDALDDLLWEIGVSGEVYEKAINQRDNLGYYLDLGDAVLPIIKADIKQIIDAIEEVQLFINTLGHNVDKEAYGVVQINRKFEMVHRSWKDTMNAANQMLIRFTRTFPHI